MGVDAEGYDELAAMAWEEHADLASQLPELEERIAYLLLPQDEADEAGAILEVWVCMLIL
jgi:protein subunit release factor A